jgi:hypothetical protein
MELVIEDAEVYKNLHPLYLLYLMYCNLILGIYYILKSLIYKSLS